MSQYRPYLFRKPVTQALLASLTSLGLVLAACSEESSSDGGAGGQGGGGASNSGSGGATGGKSSTGDAGSGNPGGSDTGGTGGAVSEPFDDTIPEVTVSALEDLPDRSAPDYGDNEHGVISGGTLASWVRDWENHRPSEITGKLVVLQVVPSGVYTEQVLRSDKEHGVYSYLVGASTFNQARDNGLSDFETDLPGGEKFDAFLKLYDIDPRKDLIVLDFEQQPNTTNAVVQSIGRAWLFLRYWGVDKNHLAILNGSINYNATYFPDELELGYVAAGEFDEPPNDGRTTARHLGVDNTVLWLTVEEIKAYLDEDDSAPATADVRIIDARGGAEALGLPWATSTGRTTCAGYADKPGGGASGSAVNKCSTPIEGRIRGAKSVPWTGLIDTAGNGFRFLPPSTLADIFKTQGEWSASSKEAWVYCRTNQRSTVNGIVASVILGYPTRFYETSFIEWGHLAGGPVKDYGPTEATQFFTTNPYNATSVAPNKSVIVDGDATAGLRVDGGRSDLTDEADNYSYTFDATSYTEHALLDSADLAKYVAGGTLGTLTKPVTWVPGPLYNAERYVAPKVAGTYPSSGWPLLNPAATTSRATIEADQAYLRGE